MTESADLEFTKFERASMYTQSTSVHFQPYALLHCRSEQLPRLKVKRNPRAFRPRPTFPQLKLRPCLFASSSLPYYSPLPLSALCCFSPSAPSHPPSPMEKDSQPPIMPDLEASPSPEAKSPRQSSFMRRWKETVDPANADLVCLLLCFLTGLCDSSAYNAWSCFLGMQTGRIPLSSRKFN
jgi:hypothetical protein